MAKQQAEMRRPPTVGAAAIRSHELDSDRKKAIEIAMDMFKDMYGPAIKKLERM